MIMVINFDNECDNVGVKDGDDNDNDDDNDGDDDDDDDDWQWQITDGPHTVRRVPRQGMCGVLARPQGLLSKTKTVRV